MYQKRETATWQIVEYLQRFGSATIKELEQHLGVTTTAVRQHLSTLQAEGYIQRRAIHDGVGRPHHAYTTTEKTRELFACNCDDLALTLLQEVFALEGKEKTALLLERVGYRLANRYSPSVRSAILQDRVEELAGALYRQGVLTDVATADDNTIILKTYNCPYHDLAQEHREVCEMDEGMMRQLLGSDVNLSACMMDGHGSCSFVVSAKRG
ncbi:MAG: DeoR family transcriptional regulator [Caldilineaceae bacterium]|nr:DeoR family transcriptional regulator [Caldilineaceae bacterium]